MPWLCAVSRASLGYCPLQSQLYQWMRDRCAILLNEADKRGELSAVDIVHTVEILLAALHNINFHIQEHGFITEQILQGLRRIFIEGLNK
jgi:hypothetical protein